MAPARAFLAVVLVALMTTPVASADPDYVARVVWEESYPMDVLPEDAQEPWSRIGTAPLFHFDSGTILLNDNSRNTRIAYQTRRNEIEAEHRVSLRARVKVLSNLEGRAAVMEIARPGMQAVLRLYPDRVELMERLGNDDWRWLGSAAADLSSFRELELHKASVLEDPEETLRVDVDGQEVLLARPSARGEGVVGRLVLGSVAHGAIGASEWDRVDYVVERLMTPPPPVPISLGALKNIFRP